MSDARQQTAIPSDIPVLIVGGGPTGLMASILVGRFGVPNLLVEKRPSTSRFPKARRLRTRTMEILRVLGIEPEIRAREQEVGALPLMLGGDTLQGPVRFRIDGDRREEMYRYSPTTWALIPQDEVEPILRGHAERQETSQVWFGVEVTGLDQDAGGVTVDLVEHMSGERRSVRADYLIAADGAHSFVRTAVGIGMSSDDRWIFLCPEFPDATPERCAGLVRTAARVPDLSVEIVAISRWERAVAVAHRFRAGRVFLAGDAAHRLTPAGAFGLNTGVQDVHNLAWKLSGVLAGWVGDGLLDSYEIERRPVAMRNVDLSRRFWDSGMGAAVGYDLGLSYERGALAPDGTALPAVPDPVSEYVPTARPGSRAPHCWLSTDSGVSTIDLFHRDFVLLTGRRDSGWRTAAARIAEEGVPISTVDPPAARWASQFGVEPGGAVLVRPDGHVAWRTRSAAESGPKVEAELRNAVDRILYGKMAADLQPELSTTGSSP